MSNITSIYIGFSGKIGTGKNYIAENIFMPELVKKLKLNNADALIVPLYYSFGDHVKIECLCRNSYDVLSIKDGFESFFINKTNYTRSLLQSYATENGRNTHHEDIWIRALESWVAVQLDRLNKLKMKIIAIIVITDIRFMNELNYVLNNDGIIIRVVANNRTDLKLIDESQGDEKRVEAIKNHSSETALDNYNFKHFINNDFDVLNENLVNNIKYIIEYYF